MTEEIIQQFNLFIRKVDDEIIKFINLKDNKLTEHISSIHEKLWKQYKEINGTSDGFWGIDEYIVFSTLKNFIENVNSPEKFKNFEINKDLRYFHLKKNNKILMIYRASKLEHIGFESDRAPDIIIVRKEDCVPKPVAVIEIKNYLDKRSTNSAIKMLGEVQKGLKDNHTKYVLFSFNKISVGDKKVLKNFTEKQNNFLITNEGGTEFKVVDLLKFFSIIKDEVKL